MIPESDSDFGIRIGICWNLNFLELELESESHDAGIRIRIGIKFFG